MIRRPVPSMIVSAGSSMIVELGPSRIVRSAACVRVVVMPLNVCAVAEDCDVLDEEMTSTDDDCDAAMTVELDAL